MSSISEFNNSILLMEPLAMFNLYQNLLVFASNMSLSIHFFSFAAEQAIWIN